MKLKLEDKLKIIELYENGWTVKQISLKYGLYRTIVEHIERQYREHGIESFKEKGNNSKYPIDFKSQLVFIDIDIYIYAKIILVVSH